mgnify:FL=1
MSSESKLKNKAERFCNDELRSAENTANSRSQAYGLFSVLLSSPHDQGFKSKILSIQTDSQLPYSIDFDDLINEFKQQDEGDLKNQYSSLFEIGNSGPPAPIREDSFLHQPAGLREDLVRFHDYFGYTLSEEFQWQMDHLSIELEFMYFLCFQEHNAEDNRLSYQLAQLDFSKRHLFNWIPKLMQTLKTISKDVLYTKVVVELNRFIEDDMRWQMETICHQ